ncbi:MAG TPA: tetratricopeptide repeat protein [Bryobacteraceae bacterium]|nr:tetratricopeptide repeat protein [Bryobacteraceae bacterium]
MRLFTFARVACLLVTGAVLAQTSTPAPAASPALATGSAEDRRADAYYHYSLGHLYSEMAGAFGNRGEYFDKAADNYRQALKDDPGATFIAEELSDLYLQSGRVRDAVVQAESIIKQNPNDVNNRRILARIYSRLIGEPQQAAGEPRRIDETMLKKSIEQYQKITELDPKDVDSWIWLGRLQKIAQNTPEAKNAFQSALKADPDNTDAMTGLATVYADVGDTNAATDLLKKVAEKDPSTRSLTTLAGFYEQMKEYKLAAEALRKAIEVTPDNNTDLQRSLAEDLMFSGQFDAALKVFQELASEEPTEVKWQLRISQVYRQMRNFAKAGEASAKARQMAPDDIEVGYNDVSLLEAQGKLPEAIKALNDLLASTEKTTYSDAEKENRARLLETLGNLYRTNEQYSDAVTAYKRLEDLDARLAPRAEAQIVETWRTAKDYQKADQVSAAAAKKYPDDALVQNIRASLLADMGHYDDAIAATKKLLGGKDDLSTWKSLAQIYEKAKNFTEMSNALDQADKLAASKDDKVEVEFLRGAMFERLKKFDDAEASFRKVLSLDPDNASAMNYLGYMFADQNVKLDEAEKLVGKALELEPNNGAYMDSLGWVYFRQKKLPQAEEQLRRALQKLSRDATVHEHLGDVYSEEGRTRDAIQQWQSSVKEFQSGAPTDLDQEELAKVQKKLEGARVRLARENHPRP